MRACLYHEGSTGKVLDPSGAAVPGWCSQLRVHSEKPSSKLHLSTGDVIPSRIKDWVIGTVQNQGNWKQDGRATQLLPEQLPKATFVFRIGRVDVSHAIDKVQIVQQRGVLALPHEFSKV